jgi:predicted nucleic acid-binding protein
MVYLLDTNVVSEAIKPQPAERVVAWLAAQPSSTVYLSVLTLGEIEQGIVRSPHPRRAERLTRWLEDELQPQFRGRILPIDTQVMKTWGQVTGRALLQGRPVSYADSLLAATAVTHGMTLVTRNVGDVAALPVQTLNPWDWTPDDSGTSAG